MNLELEIKQLIIEALRLEDITPAQIGSDELLFAGGLGFDSIDALELGVALRKKYGIRIETITDDVKAHFACVRSLAEFVAAQRNM